MHPAFSVLFFTVTSGFGFGFLFCLLIAYHTGYLGIEFSDVTISLIIATMVYTAGLMSSTFHLANPKNAWRSFARFRSSWLSREAVFAVLSYPLMLAYWVANYYSQSSASLLVAVVLVVLVIALVYCTAMIYASLKTIPQWHNRLVTPLFMLMSLASGLVLLVALHPTSWLSRGICISVLMVCLVLKISYYRQLGRPTMNNINTATGFSQASVSLFDSGHSSRNFSEREFIYQVGPKTTLLARRFVLWFGFGLTAILLGAALDAVAVATLYTGLLVERWLFFVEAKHVVRHYYGKG